METGPFTLHPRLEAGGFDFGKLGICRILLKDNALFPWLILVPEVDDSITELHQLHDSDYTSVSSTIRQISTFVQHHFKADKINVAAIGNQVSQLHIHIIARYTSDPAWPGVVWSHPDKAHYTQEEVNCIRDAWAKNFLPD